MTNFLHDAIVPTSHMQLNTEVNMWYVGTYNFEDNFDHRIESGGDFVMLA